jgi:hypothetical protein
VLQLAETKGRGRVRFAKLARHSRYESSSVSDFNDAGR